jgi:hypothetical protein
VSDKEKGNEMFFYWYLHEEWVKWHRITVKPTYSMKRDIMSCKKEHPVLASMNFFTRVSVTDVLKIEPGNILMIQ